MSWEITKEQDPRRSKIDVAGLERELHSTTKAEVRFDEAARAMFSCDASNYRQVPLGVVFPHSAEEVIGVVAACRKFGAPIVSRGGGTGLCGQTCNYAVVIDHSKHHNRLLEINADQGFARVQPGLVLDDLRHVAESKHRLTYGPDPATHNHCTFGGMIGNNSCGVHSVMAGKTVDNVLELDVVTYDGLRMKVGPTSEKELEAIIARGGRQGEIYKTLRDIRDRSAEEIRRRYPDIPRRVSGYNLDQLLPENGFNMARALVGTESTCVVVLEAKVRLVHSPPARSLLVLGYEDVYSAADHIQQIMACGPIGLEAMDDRLVQYMKKKQLHTQYLHLLPQGGGWLIAEFGGENKDEADEKAHRCIDSVKAAGKAPQMRLYDNEEAEHEVWLMRESGLGATAIVPGMPLTWPGWEDAAVAPNKLGNYLREFRQLLNRHDLLASLYGHFGQGCIHCRISFDMFTKHGVDNYLKFIDEASDLVVKHNGSFSAEHGDGQSKAIFLPKMYGNLVDQFRRFKQAFDPDWKMNPGKVVDPWRPEDNLRLGPRYHPWSPETHFQFNSDDHSFSRATLRCVGVGKCRRTGNVFMCPSYLVTHDEIDCTRGRAHMLHEMCRRDVITDGWKSKAVMKSLDLCLGCKGCKTDCPVNVDMATYKSEFLSHHWGLIKPRKAYSMGLIGLWASMGSAMPRTANFFSGMPMLRNVTRWLAGVSQKRPMPKFAHKTFEHWFRKSHSPKSGDRGKIVLYPDEFNNAFYPGTLRACTMVLERWGYEVIVPKGWVPGLRPLIHYGWLKMAKKKLEKTLDVLRPLLEQELPIIMAEPSAAAVFRDELPLLLPGHIDSERLNERTWLLSELAIQQDLPIPKLSGKAIFHGHCHQKAVLKVKAMRELLKKMGLEVQEPQEGCCGMAGSFGFEAEHYDLSQQIGEIGLLPAVRKAPPETLIVADGFSCRTQIHDGTGRMPLHCAELLEQAFARQERS